jgi:Spy/CpxP family protein refolding chaperone
MSKNRWSALVLGAVMAIAFASSALAGDGSSGDAPKDGARASRRAALRERLREGVKRRRMASMKFLESLQATDEQRALVLEKAKAAAPILAEARRQARTILAQARASNSKDGAKIDRKAARESVKAQIQTIRDQARAQIDGLAKDVVASLTPEQRQKLQDVAARHGKTVDDARLTRLAAALISRPMTSAYLEARQAK